MVEQGLSRREALSRYHLDPRTFQRHVGPGMEKRGPRWAAKRADRLPAVMQMQAADAEIKVRVVTRTAAERRLISEHDLLIKAYRRLYVEGAPPGESYEALERDLRRQFATFEGRRIDGHPFLTDIRKIRDRIDRETLEPEGPYPDEG